MTWTSDSLTSKAKLFFEKAFAEERSSPFFGLFCSLGLEFLVRSSVAWTSPTLLARGDSNQQNLLAVLGHEPPQKATSISVSLAADLCARLYSGFTEKDRQFVRTMFERRNAELHSGQAAFEAWPANQWIADFYRCCQSLCNVQDIALAEVIGSEDKTAQRVLEQTQREVITKVKLEIQECRSAFQDLDGAEQESRMAEAEKRGELLSRQRHHRVKCPACGCIATVQGFPFGEAVIVHGDGEIIEKISVLPETFECAACSLKLKGHAELNVAEVGEVYTRTTIYSPSEFYDLIDPESDDMSYYVDKYLDIMGRYEYDNE